MTVLETTVVAQLHGADVGVESGTSTLDSGAVPYATAQLVFPLLDEGTLAWADPQDGRRVVYTAAVDETREFDLGLRSRRIDHGAKTVTLDLASDEALLMDYRPLTMVEGIREYDLSVRDMCSWMLARIGATLEPGTADADVSAAWEVTNLCTNPTCDTAAGYVLGTNASTLGVGNTSPAQGTGYVRWVGTAAGFTFLSIPIADNRVTPGETYTVYGSMRASSAGQQGRMYVQFKDSTGAIVGGKNGDLGALPTGTAWGEPSVTFTVPPGVVTAIPYAVGSGAAGVTYALDKVMYYKHAEYLLWFDGNSVDPLYTFTWEGTPGASSSTRHPHVERRPEAFLWPPGVSAWEFLLTFTTAGGLILWCDEQRRWWLDAPESRSLPASVTVSASHLSAATDTIDLADTDSTPTGVIVKYTWNDDSGIQQTRYDSAGTPTRATLIERATPYPGAGVAAGILARRQGTGRRQEVTALARLAATPGMSTTVILAAAPTVVGRLQKVVFDHATGLMDIVSAGSVDIIPGSVRALTGTINALTGTVNAL